MVCFFYYRDYLGNRKQFRYKMGINYLETKKERTLEGNAIIKAMIVKLESGWNPLTKEKEEIREDKTVSDRLDEILLLKKSYITEKLYLRRYCLSKASMLPALRR